ncbi:unnamed protein product [Peniophora sp. CBMAI 1063]|nr:unnamed protein product [Peniophora sp. CBMAI 1063]
MSGWKALYKHLNRRMKKHRAEKYGLIYEDEDEINLSLLHKEELPDGTRLAPATEEEIEFSRRDGLGGGIDWKNFRKYFTLKHWTRNKIVGLFITTSIITLVVLLLVFQDSIVEWLVPSGEKWKSLPGGWTIPIAILIVQSFPPLIGHDVVQIFVGVVWGLWPGFGIVAAGTVLGEIAEFYVFRLFCGARMGKMEKKSLGWGLLADVARDGGFVMVLIARLSVLPPSYTTIVFALAGTNFFKFLAALILSLVLPLSNLYLGVLARENSDGVSTSGAASGLTIAGSVTISVVAMLYIDHKANKLKPAFITQRRKDRFDPSAEGRLGSPAASSTPYDPPS